MPSLKNAALSIIANATYLYHVETNVGQSLLRVLRKATQNEKSSTLNTIAKTI